MSISVKTAMVETSDKIKLSVNLFSPLAGETKRSLAFVLVHPYSLLGGCQSLLQGMAVLLAEKGYVAATFDMRGVGSSTGRSSLTGSSEIKDVLAVCKSVSNDPGLACERILLVGVSAGAAIAGSAIDKIREVVGYISIGYPFGTMASILFRQHHKAMKLTLKPKLFVMGTCDGFTSVKQLQSKLESFSGRVETHLVAGLGHFETVGAASSTNMTQLFLHFAESL